jgi:hypothetical protein
MTKYLFVFIACFLFAGAASCQKAADTTIVLLKVFPDFTIPVMKWDQADYYRLILPPDPGDNRYNIKEFYKDRKLKRIGKAYAGASYRNLISGVLMYDGDCVSYFPSGAKSSVSRYKNGEIDGLEDFFYSTGNIYYRMKHVKKESTGNDIARYWEWYDADGNELCKNGNGNWISYYNDFKTIKCEGKVVDGQQDGEWPGILIEPDTIKYARKYSKGALVSSTGYDKQGKAYPFETEWEKASYRIGEVNFVDILRGHIKIPRDSAGKKMSMDTAHVSFVVERDGHLNNFNMLGNVDPKLTEAVFAGLAKCHAWIPSKVFGVPVRTRVVMPLGETSGFTSNGYRKEIMYEEKILKGDQ